MKLQRLTDKSLSKVRVVAPVSEEELLQREKDYDILSKNHFSKKYSGLLYKPVDFIIENKRYSIQVNFCTNPFCKLKG